MNDAQAIAEYISNACKLQVYPATKSLIAGTLSYDQNNKVQISLVKETDGDPLSCGLFDVTGSVAGTGDPFVKANGQQLTISGTVPNGTMFTLDGVGFQFHSITASVPSGQVAAGSGLSSASDAMTNLLAAFATQDQLRDISVSSVSSTVARFYSNVRKFTASEDHANLEVKFSAKMERGVAQVEVVVPADTYVAAETQTLTVDNITAPDGRTLTGGTWVGTHA